VKRMNSFKHLTQVFIFACAVGCASASTLVSIKGCTYTYIDPVSGSMKPASGQFIYFDLCRPFNVLANQFNKTYIAYGPIVDTMQVLEVHGWDGEWLFRTYMEYTALACFYDRMLQKYIALDFSGVYEISISNGQMKRLVGFTPEMQSMPADAYAIDERRHWITFLNSSGEAFETVTTYDYVSGKLIASRDIVPAPEQQINPVWFDGATSTLIGYADRAFWKIDPLTGKRTLLAKSDYIPFGLAMGAIDPATHRLTFVGTDGKEHCFVVTIDLDTWKILYEPMISPDLSALPTGLAYLPI